MRGSAARFVATPGLQDLCCIAQDAWAPCVSGTFTRSERAYIHPVTSDPKAETKEENMSIIGKYKDWRAYRRTVNELSGLSNRELADLGINRADIPFVARRAR